jgi:hypothetical protein
LKLQWQKAPQLVHQERGLREEAAMSGRQQKAKFQKRYATIGNTFKSGMGTSSGAVRDEERHVWSALFGETFRLRGWLSLRHSTAG